MDPTSEMYNYISANSLRLPQTLQPLDCSSRILDLCVRRRAPSPQPFKVEKNNNLPVKQEAPSSPRAISSCSPVSDISPLSTSPNPFYEIPSHINVPSPAGSKSRLPRPFKAYPKDPLTMASGINAAVFDKESAEAYAEFRKNMLYCVQGTNGITNKNMRRATHASSSSKHDPIYWEKRRKNNEAAKKSRDARRAKEDEIAIRAAFLEQENIQLKYTLASVKNELNELKRLVYNRSCVKITGPYMGVEYNS